MEILIESILNQNTHIQF